MHVSIYTYLYLRQNQLPGRVLVLVFFMHVYTYQSELVISDAKIIPVSAGVILSRNPVTSYTVVKSCTGR